MVIRSTTTFVSTVCVYPNGRSKDPAKRGEDELVEIPIKPGCNFIPDAMAKLLVATPVFGRMKEKWQVFPVEEVKDAKIDTTAPQCCQDLARVTMASALAVIDETYDIAVLKILKATEKRGGLVVAIQDQLEKMLEKEKA